MNDPRPSFELYSETLLRSVVDALIKPRTKLPAEELLDRLLSTLENAALIDRRISDLPSGSQAAIIAVSRSGQARWSVGQFITLAASVGHAEGFRTVLELLNIGLIVPVTSTLPIPDFDAWFAANGGLRAEAFVPESVRRRAAAIAYKWPVLDSVAWKKSANVMVDHLDVPLKLVAIRQRVEAESVRLTKNGTLYKKDQSRFDGDAVLTDPMIVDSGFLSLYWAVATGLLIRDGETLRVATFPDEWNGSIHELVGQLLAGSFSIEYWLPLIGSVAEFHGDRTAFATAALLLLILLAAVPANQGIATQAMADWLWENHPSWSSIIPSEHSKDRGTAWIDAYVNAIVGPLGLVDSHDGVLHLTALGRKYLNGTPAPELPPTFPQSLLVQPNSEILAYRQGLTPPLIRTLSRFAWWKVIGPACTLELTAEQVYRGLESGMSVAEILQTLQKHGSRAVPSAVDDLIRRWGSKRERVSVFASATLVEFATAEDLEAAMSRGLISHRLTDRVGLTADGSDPDYASLRLTGNRDYEARQQPCLKIDPNGLTWTIDATFADLLLDAELARFSNPVVGEPMAARQVRADAEKIQGMVSRGMSIEDLETWFLNRAGQSMPPVIRLFAMGPRLAPAELRRELVIKLSDEAMCDGVMQWPATRSLIRERLGPMTVVIDESNWNELSAMLNSIGVPVNNCQTNPVS